MPTGFRTYSYLRLDRCFLAIQFFIFSICAAVLWFNGYSINIVDSERYVPRNPVFTFGSQIPRFVSSLIYDYGGDRAFAVMSILLGSYALARLHLAIFNKFAIHNNVGRYFLLLLVLLCSLTPLLMIMVASEPYSTVSLAVILAIIISHKFHIIDFVLIAFTAAAHSSNVLLIGTFCFFILLRDFRKHLLIVVFILIAVLCSQQIDRYVYRKDIAADQRDNRLQLAFAGATILNFYPYVLDHICQSGGDSKFCQPEVYAFIRAKRQPYNNRSLNFLWNESSFLDYFEGSQVPRKFRLTNSQYNQESKILVREFLLQLPVNLGSFLEITFYRFRKLIEQPLIFETLPLTKRTGLWVQDYKQYSESYCGSKKCERGTFVFFVDFIKYFQLILSFIVLPVILFCRRLWTKMQDIVVPLMLMYGLNLGLFSVLSTSLPRYHLRCFLPLSYLAIIAILFLFISNPLEGGTSKKPEKVN